MSFSVFGWTGMACGAAVGRWKGSSIDWAAWWTARPLPKRDDNHLRYLSEMRQGNKNTYLYVTVL